MRGLKDGDPVEVRLADLNDWMYIRGEEMVGGFTVKVLDRKQRP